MVMCTAWCIVTSLLMLEKNEDKALDVNLKLRHAFYSATIQVKQPFSSPKAIHDSVFLIHAAAVTCLKVTQGDQCHSLSVTHWAKLPSML